MSLFLKNMQELLEDAIGKARQRKALLLLIPEVGMSIISKPGVVGVFFVPSPETEEIRDLLVENEFCQVARDEMPGGDTGQDLYEKTVGVDVQQPSLN